MYIDAKYYYEQSSTETHFFHDIIGFENQIMQMVMDCLSKMQSTSYTVWFLQVAPTNLAMQRTPNGTDSRPLFGRIIYIVTPLTPPPRPKKNWK